MSASANKPTEETESVFQKKYDEFAEDLMGALPEYASQVSYAQALSQKDRLERFQAEVKFNNTMSGGNSEEFQHNPNTVLPGVTISDAVWTTLSDQTKKAIWEHVRILSICCFMSSMSSTPSIWSLIFT
jgi:5'-deoxynucleotidase YfbR-like HD superfamily hydrolase